MWLHAQSHEHFEHVDSDIGLWALAIVLLAGLGVVFGLSIGNRFARQHWPFAIQTNTQMSKLLTPVSARNIQVILER